MKTLNMFDRIFNRWTKWELHEENLPYIRSTYQSPILGGAEIAKDSVIVDIYVKTNKFTGIKKYKKVIKK